MGKSKIIFGLSLVAILASTSCNAKGITHPRSSDNHIYQADLNHDGIIADFTLDGKLYHEDNLTWKESYDTLLEEANSMPALNAAADNFGIAETELKRTSLARYEILHQAEEMLVQTQTVTPLYNYADPYLLKPEVTNVYAADLGYKFFDQLQLNKEYGKDFKICFGTKADTFDPAVNTDASTANVLSQMYVGAKRWTKSDKLIEEGRDGAYLAKLSDGICDVKKHLVTSDPEKAQEEEYVSFDECEDLTEEMDQYTKPEEKQQIRDNYEGTARYTFTIGNDTVEDPHWSNGDPVTADDFIYAWTRASSGIYNNAPMGMWCSLWDMIRGYNAWNKIGQQELEKGKDFEEFDTKKDYASVVLQKYSPTTDLDDPNVQTLPHIVKKQGEKKYAFVSADYKANSAGDWEDAIKKEFLSEIDSDDMFKWHQANDMYGAAGGMAGVMKDENDPKKFTVQLINDSDYFESLLAFPAWMPVKKSEIIIRHKDNSGKEVSESDAVCTERPSWYMNKRTSAKPGDDDYPGQHYTTGALEIDGPIDNNDGGKISLKKATKTNVADEHTVNTLTCLFIDKDGAGYDSYKSGAVQMIDAVPSGVIDQVRKEPEKSGWRVAPQIGLFFFIFNVNDNTFDYVTEPEYSKNPDIEEIKKHRRYEDLRQKLRSIMNILVNRNDLCQNIVKSGATGANGVVSTDIIEQCVPEWDSEGINPLTGEPTGAWKAKKDGTELATADWHDRNGDMYYRWNKTGEDAYKEHWMGHRSDGGFYDVANTTDIEEEKRIMGLAQNRALEIAKDIENNYKDIAPGFKYDEATGKFVNFPRISLSTNTGTGIEDICERMQAYYSLWGINVSIETQEWQSFTATRRAGDYSYARHGWVADYNDPRTYLDIFKATDGNNDTQLGRDTRHTSK